MITLSGKDDSSILLEASTAGQFAHLGPDRLTGAREVAFYVVYSEEAVGGSVAIEGAHSVGHAGEWALLKVVPWVRAGQAHYVALTGAHLALRARVVENVIGGTVSVYAVGN